MYRKHERKNLLGNDDEVILSQRIYFCSSRAIYIYINADNDDTTIHSMCIFCSRQMNFRRTLDSFTSFYTNFTAYMRRLGQMLYWQQVNLGFLF